MNAVVIGRRRQGKSTLALRLCLTYHRTVFVFDPNNQFPSLESVNTIEELEDWLGQDVEHGVIRFVPDPTRVEDDFSDLVDVIWPLGNYALLIDEAGSVQRPQGLHPQLERLMRQAPRDGATNTSGQITDVSICQTVHRPTDCHSLCRALATDTFLFQAQLRRDLDLIESQYGDSVSSKLPALKRWELVHTYTDLNGRQQYSIWRNHQQWFIPIS